MADNINHLQSILSLSQALGEKGIQPVLIGGMALILLGSQRVTKDFDFLVSSRGLPIQEMLEEFYKEGFELVTKFNKQREVLRTIDNPRVAAIKLREDLPDSLFFFNWETRLRVDLLLDFPLPASDILTRATRLKIPPGSLWVASDEDLLRLKEIAYADRHSSSDAQDIEFLKERRGS